MVSELANIFTDLHSLLHFMSYALSSPFEFLRFRSLLKALNDFPLLFKFLKITVIIHIITNFTIFILKRSCPL